jgi:hypothetical protein
MTKRTIFEQSRMLDSISFWRVCGVIKNTRLTLYNFYLFSFERVPVNSAMWSIGTSEMRFEKDSIYWVTKGLVGATKKIMPSLNQR